ncbi:MAG: relaxase, partial [Eubacteriales bacterium]
KDLKTLYAELLASKKKAYKTYSDLNEESKEVLNAKRNVEIILDIDNSTTEKEKQKDDKSL